MSSFVFALAFLFPTVGGVKLYARGSPNVLVTGGRFVANNVRVVGDSCIAFRIPFEHAEDTALEISLHFGKNTDVNPYDPPMKYIALAAPQFSGVEYNNTIEHYADCDVDFSHDSCWDSVGAMGGLNLSSPKCVRDNMAAPGNGAFEVVLAQHDGYLRDQIRYHNSLTFHYLGSDVETCETYGGDYYVFVRGRRYMDFSFTLTAKAEGVSMYCWTRSTEGWVMMWIIVLCPFMMFVCAHRVRNLREQCRSRVVPEPNIEIVDDEEPVTMGLAMGTMKPPVMAVVVDDEDSSKLDDETDDIVVDRERIQRTFRIQNASSILAAVLSDMTRWQLRNREVLQSIRDRESPHREDDSVVGISGGIVDDDRDNDDSVARDDVVSRHRLGSRQCEEYEESGSSTASSCEISRGGS